MQQTATESALGRTIGVRLSKADEARLLAEAARVRRKVRAAGCQAVKVSLSDVLREVVRRGLAVADAGPDVAPPRRT
jgi:hypothetical protein